jgi:hypothetical protein
MSRTTQASGGRSPTARRPSPNEPSNQLELNRRNRRTSREMAMNILNHALCVAALSLLISVPSRAENVEVETGVFCDTQQQMERYVALYSGNTQTALNALNTEVKDPTACVYGTIAYIRGPEIATVRNKNETYHIVRVIVIGFMTHSGFRASAPAASFSAEKIDERVA